MSDSVTGVPVYVLANLSVASTVANQVGVVSDADTFTITTPGTNASVVSQTVVATTVVHSGAATGGVITVTVGVSGEVTAVTCVDVEGLVAADTITISAIDSDAMDTNCVLTVDQAPKAVRDRWNQRAVIAVSDAAGDGGDGAARAYFVSKSLNSPWIRGGAKLGNAIILTDGTGVDVVVPR
jgi:hypothetical protein